MPARTRASLHCFPRAPSPRPRRVGAPGSGSGGVWGIAYVALTLCCPPIVDTNCGVHFLTAKIVCPIIKLSKQLTTLLHEVSRLQPTRPAAPAIALLCVKSVHMGNICVLFIVIVWGEGRGKIDSCFLLNEDGGEAPFRKGNRSFHSGL